MTCLCLGYATHHLLPAVTAPRSFTVSPNRISVVQFRLDGAPKWKTCCVSGSIPSPRIIRGVLRAAASTSAQLGGYSEELHVARPPQKTRKIAGIDQEEIEDPTLLADPDSCFCEFNGVQLHHKISDAELSDTSEEGSSSLSSNSTKRFNVPMILLHGFGASVFSWNRVMKPLAQITGSKVLAFDRPAFGLTSRVNAVKHASSGNQESRSLNPYSMAFSAMATLYFIDFLAAKKAILVGHSAGALVAVDAYFHSPECVAALILVAPAIFAPFSWQNTAKKDDPRVENRIWENNTNSDTSREFFPRLRTILSKITKYLTYAIVSAVKGMAKMINSVYRKVLSAILRSTIGLMLIRMVIDKFGVPGVRAAWYEASQVSDHVLQGYTKPLKVKGWDKALVEFTVAMLTDSAPDLKVPLAERLTEISCPVLVVTGDTDRLVPAWNSERLARAIPGSSFEVIKKCGHLPQEEKAEEFVSIVDKFLQRVFGTAEEPCLQPIA